VTSRRRSCRLPGGRSAKSITTRVRPGAGHTGETARDYSTRISDRDAPTLGCAVPLTVVSCEPPRQGFRPVLAGSPAERSAPTRAPISTASTAAPTGFGVSRALAVRRPPTSNCQTDRESACCTRSSRLTRLGGALRRSRIRAAVCSMRLSQDPTPRLREPTRPAPRRPPRHSPRGCVGAPGSPRRSRGRSSGHRQTRMGPDRRS